MIGGRMRTFPGILDNSQKFGISKILENNVKFLIFPKFKFLFLTISLILSFILIILLIFFNCFFATFYTVYLILKILTIILIFFVIFLYSLFNSRDYTITYLFNITALKNCFRQNLKKSIFPNLNGILSFFNTSISMQLIILYPKTYKTIQVDK